LVYAADLKSASFTGLWVRVPSRPPAFDFPKGTYFFAKKIMPRLAAWALEVLAFGESDFAFALLRVIEHREASLMEVRRLGIHRSKSNIAVAREVELVAGAILVSDAGQLEIADVEWAEGAAWSFVVEDYAEVDCDAISVAIGILYCVKQCVLCGAAANRVRSGCYFDIHTDTSL